MGAAHSDSGKPNFLIPSLSLIGTTGLLILLLMDRELRARAGGKWAAIGLFAATVMLAYVMPGVQWVVDRRDRKRAEAAHRRRLLEVDLQREEQVREQRRLDQLRAKRRGDS